MTLVLFPEHEAITLLSNWGEGSFSVGGGAEGAEGLDKVEFFRDFEPMNSFPSIFWMARIPANETHQEREEKLNAATSVHFALLTTLREQHKRKTTVSLAHNVILLSKPDAVEWDVKLIRLYDVTFHDSSQNRKLHAHGTQTCQT